jgi:hypothetical protein
LHEGKEHHVGGKYGETGSLPRLQTGIAGIKKTPSFGNFQDLQLDIVAVLGYFEERGVEGAVAVNFKAVAA